MSRRIADLLIKIGADSYEFQQRVQQVEKGLDGLSKKLNSVGKELSLKLTAPLVAFGAFSLKAFDDSAKATTKVQQAIKSTAGAARLSFEELSKFAGELQGKTLFEDDFILNNATAQLLTFTNIAGENFQRTQRVALDLSTVLDGDLKSASIQLGKALNDPVKNLSALSRSGIQFSEEQKKVINSLAETGRLAEAQAVILDELERQYGGQAEAAAKVGIGSLQQLKNSWGDFLEQIGAAMMPMMNRLAASLKNVVEWLQNLSPATKRTIVVVATVAAAIGPLALGLGSLLKMLPLLKTGFAVLLAPIGAVRTALQALMVAMATNPIGLLLAALSAGVGLFLAFRKSTDEATGATGEHTSKILDESKQVNLLIAKLTSANTSEQERKAALEELRKIQPAIVEGLNAVLLQLASFLKQIGTQLIEFGLMIVAFQSALKSVLANPWVAIGVGAAMVAAAAVMTALINKNAQKNVPKLAQGGLAYGPTYAMVGDNPGARVDPEVIAPLSKLRSMMTGGGTQNIAITLGGQLTAKGRDLVYVLAKENFKIDLLGG